jgi:flavin reductase (DIM6/NTAB) family NADH-FMN oxidoreductase RutF
VSDADAGPADVDAASFRRAAGQFASGIVVVTTRSGHAMTVSAFTSVSLAPPLVLFCAEKIARFHDAVVAAGWWAVCILGEDAEKTARWLATRGRPMDGQLSEVAHHPGPVTGAPVLDDALAVLECRTTAVHDGGDHSIVVGRVAGVSGLADPPQHGPLVHHAGAYRRLALARYGRLDPVQPPVEVFVAYHQRRREPDRVPVRLLGEHAVRRQPLAHLAPR